MKAGVINTYSGKEIDIVNTDPASIDIRDIAHALSLICRGSGQSHIYFPVARHCVLCAKEAMLRGDTPEVALACLLHDAAEAYMSDVPKPVKMLLPAYCELEDRILSCVYRKFIGRDLTEAEVAEVHTIDKTLLMYDLSNLLCMEVELPPLSLLPDYTPEEPKSSEKAYLEAFAEISQKIKKSIPV